MQLAKSWLFATLGTLAAFSTIGIATAQTITATISGRVSDGQGLALPGVTVNVTSPSLQGIRTVTTSANGHYIVAELPSGTYTISFGLSGFQALRRTVDVAPTQAVPLDVTLGIASVAETVNVVGRTASVLTQTAQVVTDFRQELIAALPTNRSIDAPLLLAPAVHPTGPAGQYSVAGSMSFENLFMVNGVDVNENLRGSANTLFIEDAIQETTIATSAVSAEYGRFTGGVVNVVTKSGGNLLGGSFRDTLADDNWRSLTPFPGDTKIAKVIPTYEYTLGGPLVKDRLWFFTAGRLQNQAQGKSTAVTNIPYITEDNSKRFEGKLTYSIGSHHTFQGNFTKTLRDQLNGTSFNVMDLASLYNGSLKQDLFTLNYSGIISPTFFLEARYSSRHWTSSGAGATSTDLIQGTLLVDRQHGNTRYWSATFCGVCDPEKRDNDDLFAKGTYFLSTSRYGSHSVVFGLDSFNDMRFANNFQSGSNYRIIGTGAIIRGTDIYPVFQGDGASTLIQYQPLQRATIGTNFRTYSTFVNDNWRVGPHVTASLGVRWDKNHGADATGQVVARDSAFSPRLGVVWDPKGDGKVAVTGSFAKYVAAINNSIADSSSPGGRTAAFQWAYRGPAINDNPNGPLLLPAAAIQQVFTWFNANGGPSLPIVAADIPGVQTTIPNSLASPNVLEYAGGVSRQIGGRGSVRVDLVYRDYRDFYAIRTDTSTGKATSVAGTFDANVIETTDALRRKYGGLSLMGTYRAAARIDVGGSYTLSHAYGNVEGENASSGPTAADVLQYREYKDPSWNHPEGDLSIDQRHRLSLWANYGVPRVDGLTLSLLQGVASGVPYGAVGLVDARSFVTNPGYVTPQGGATEAYYYTARDAFRTDTSYRTDLAVNYSYAVKRMARRFEVFGQLQVLNVFNGFQICGCGDSVFNNGGGVDLGSRIVTTVVSATPAVQRFNPFTTAPVQGVNWALAPNFGQPRSRLGYTSPRTLRVSFGVRF